MRIIFILLTLSALVSCGKDGGGSSKPNRQDQEEYPEANTDGLGWNGMELTVSSPVTVTPSEIMFNTAQTRSQQGTRIECKLSVAAGEVYQYSVNGDTLYLQTRDGNYDYKRLVAGSGSDISGTWIWHGAVSDGFTLLSKTLYISNDKKTGMLKKNCER